MAMDEHPGTVIVAHAERGSRAALRDILRRAGYVAVSAESEEEALNAIARWRPHAAVLCLPLPGADGVGLLAKVRLHHPLVRCVVVAEPNTDIENAVLRMGAAAYIPAPPNQTSLLAAVRSAVDAANLQWHLAGVDTAAGAADDAQQQLHAVFNAAPIGILVVDAPTGRIRMANEAFRRMLGNPSLEGGELNGWPELLHLRRASGDPLIPGQAPLGRAMEGQRVTREEMLVVPRGRSPFPCLVSAAPILDASHNVVGAVLVLQDVSELKRIQLDLQAAYNRERRVAQGLTKAFVPRVGTNAGGLEVASLYQPISEEARVGGDLFDLFPLPDGRYGITMADVAGKGLDAAVETATAKYLMRGYAAEHADPSVVLARANEVLCTLTGESDFITLFYGVIDVSTGILTYGNAGHELPLYLDPDGQVQVLEPTDPVLGAFPEVEYRQWEMQLSPGGTLLTYTDGITEARAGNTMLGLEGVAELLKQQHGKPAQEAVSAIYRAVARFAYPALRDDVAILLVRIPPRES